MISDRKKVYMDRKKKQLTDPDASREFFKLVKSFNTHEKPQTFDVRSLSKATSDTEVAEELAVFFNRISHEFSPLTPDDVRGQGRKNCRL